jgi:hypothetical protein
MIKNGILNYNIHNNNKPTYSSFSWWGAYLGNKNKKIYYDGSYEKYGENKDLYYLPEWIKIN